MRCAVGIRASTSLPTRGTRPTSWQAEAVESKTCCVTIPLCHRFGSAGAAHSPQGGGVAAAAAVFQLQDAQVRVERGRSGGAQMCA